MIFKDAVLNYLFRTKKNDSSSETLKGVVEDISEKLKDEELVYLTENNESLSLQEYKIETEVERLNHLLTVVSNNVDKLDKTVKEELVKFKLRLLDSTSLVKQAMLSERKLTGESYTLQVPIEKGYASGNTTATVEDNIIFGIGFDENNVSSKLDLSTLYLNSEENTDFKVTSETNSYPINIQLSENFYKPYNQIRLTINNLSQTGILYVKFNKAEAISILDSNGYEIVEPYITDRVSLNISATAKSFSIRFANNKKRTVSIKEMYFTEATYNKTTVYETLPLAIDKNLSFLTVQTCDNYSSKDIDIKYEMSINGNPYRAFRPNGKLNTKKLQSIIKTSITEDIEVKLNYDTLQDGYYRFYNDNIVNINSKLRVYSQKMSEDFLSIENFLPQTTEEFELSIYNPQDFVLKLSPNMYILLDDFYYEYTLSNKGEILIEQGLHKIRVKRDFWKEIVNLDEYEITSISEERLTVLKRDDLEKVQIEVDNYFDPSDISSNSIYLQMLQNKVAIYLVEEIKIKRKLDADFIEYLYKEDPKPLYVYSEAYQIEVSTIQIRITLDTADHKICPYVSKILVRGV